ncbi:MAG: hypothetical protein JW857_05705, partial [Bacteroidales bacterium]|nr:hypothetical protein [Bacteroidales bacterium]
LFNQQLNFIDELTWSQSMWEANLTGFENLLGFCLSAFFKLGLNSDFSFISICSLMNTFQSATKFYCRANLEIGSNGSNLTGFENLLGFRLSAF